MTRPIPPYQPGDLYLVTGRTRDGKPITRTFTSWREADEFSLFVSHKYLVRAGKRTLLRSTSPSGHFKKGPAQ